MRGMTLRAGRLKTGTPPRLKSDSINFEILEKQHSDDVAPNMSARSTRKKDLHKSRVLLLIRMSILIRLLKTTSSALPCTVEQ